MRPAGVHRELCEGIRPTADDDDAVVRRPLVTEIRPKLFPSEPGHDVPLTICHVSLTSTRIESADHWQAVHDSQG